MSERISRREAFKYIGRVTAGLALTRGVIRGQGAEIIVAGKPVEIAVASVSSNTVRITVVPIESGKPGAVPSTGTLVADGEGRVTGRGRAIAALNSIKAGSLVVRFTADPPTLHVETASGGPV